MGIRSILLIVVIIFTVFFFITTNQKTNTQENQKPIIAISTFSLYDMVNKLAGDSVDTFMILPFGVSAHSYEPPPKQVAKLYKSDLVIYSGAGLEPWIDGFDFKNKVINMSLHVDLKELDNHGHDHHHDKESKIDPHYWLDLQNMVKATQYVTKELIELFPSNKDLYVKNKDTYIGMLKKLDEDYKSRLSTCRLDTLVVNHNAFSYISSKYGFEVEALSGLSPEAEPSAKNMVKLIEHVKEHKVKTIFYESFVSAKPIKSIAKEAKVNADSLQPLGNITADTAAQNLSYEDIMRTNLEKISKALECQ